MASEQPAHTEQRRWWNAQGRTGIRWLVDRVREESRGDVLDAVVSIFADVGERAAPTLLDALEAGMHSPDARLAFLKALRVMPLDAASNERALRFEYLDGRVSLRDLATALERSPADLLAEFDRSGLDRSEEALRLQPEARAAILARLRADRLARNGAPIVDEDRVRRDVIASQRFEGIDARAHVAGRRRGPT